MIVSEIFGIVFQKLIALLPDQTNEYALTLDGTGPRALYKIVDYNVDASLLATITDAQWEASFNIYTGFGYMFQRSVSADYKWSYDCVADGFWTRRPNFLMIRNAVLDSIDDSAGLKTISFLNTAYPSATVTQIVQGVHGKYEKIVGDSWAYYAATPLAAS
ncbi:MAG: hypothetical protein LBE82_06240 [Chitinophagaceae bacterium]|jgi:hypothetical protein|nr:hypothetical protein [Chitinophagaceae bacterium]